MTYVMEKALVDHINAQRKEAEEISKQPGCWMGMYKSPTDTAYCSERVPSGTLAQFDRLELEEGAYYAVADAYSKSYARCLDLASMTDAELNKLIDDACETMDRETAEREEYEQREEVRLNNLANDIGVDRDTLNRWMEAA